MSQNYGPACQRCGHGKLRHVSGTGKCKCRNSKIDPTLRGPDGGCFCDRFVRGKTRAENIAAAKLAATGDYRFSRDPDVTHETRA